MTAGNSADAEWHLDNDVWKQEGHRFEPLSLDGVAVPAGLSDLDYAAGAKPCSQHAGFLPRQFKFSPVDGTALPAVQQTLSWLPPCASSQGNRVCGDQSGQILGDLLPRLQARWRHDGSSMQSTAIAMDAPASNGLLFFSSNVGGHRDALFALGRSGSLWLWQRASKRWLQLRAQELQLGRHGFEHWSAAVVSVPLDDGNAVVIANEAGADLVGIDPLRLQYSITRCTGKALGAPGMLADTALVPLYVQQQVQIAAYREGRWHNLAVTGDVPTDMPLLSAPVVTANGHGLVWIGERGWLDLQEQGNEFVARWQAWPDGMTAPPVLGPPFRDGDGDWQQLRTQDRGMVSVLVGATLPREHELRRASAGTGNSTFQFSVRVDRPWADYDPDDHPDALDHVIHPFIETEQSGALLFLRAQCERRISLLQFYDNRARQQVAYCVGWPASNHHSYSIDTAEPWNAQWFVHDGALWLWVDDRGTLLCWRDR